MTLGLAYWLLVLVWLVFGALLHLGYIGGPWVGGNLALPFVLFVLLGWQVFGPPLLKVGKEK